jgi:hypothetical protein
VILVSVPKVDGSFVFLGKLEMVGGGSVFAKLDSDMGGVLVVVLALLGGKGVVYEKADGFQEDNATCLIGFDEIAFDEVVNGDGVA